MALQKASEAYLVGMFEDTNLPGGYSTMSSSYTALATAAAVPGPRRRCRSGAAERRDGAVGSLRARTSGRGACA